MLLVLVDKHALAGRHELDQFVDGIVHGVSTAAAQAGAGPVTRAPGSRVTWDGDRGEADIQAGNAAITFHVAAHAYHRGDGMPLVVGVFAFTAGAAAFPAELVHALADFQHD
jgi:hypothetical protein